MIAGATYLITTDGWFVAPDGQLYSAVWGKVGILSDTVLGIKTNARSANWYAKVGPEDRHVIIAGCQIHYAVRCEERPSEVGPDIQDVHEGELRTNSYQSRIYFTE